MLFHMDSSHIEITQETILNELSKLKINKVPVINGIITRLLVENADMLCLPVYITYLRCCGVAHSLSDP